MPSKGFLPKGYKAPVIAGDYMKFQEGENRFRVMSEAVIGWEGWKDGKPFRREGIEQNIEEDEVDYDEKYKKAKLSHFWAFLVFDYADKKIKILTITQNGIMKSLEGLASDSDWGNPEEYDISVTKEKAGNRTTYSVKSYPPKPVSSEAKAALKESKADLSSIFTGDES